MAGFNSHPDGVRELRQAGVKPPGVGPQSRGELQEHRPEPVVLSWWSALFELPCVAIGGITPANAAPLVKAGADFLAVSGAVWNGDEAVAIKAFAELLG